MLGLLAVTVAVSGCKKKPKTGAGAGAGFDDFGGVLGPGMGMGGVGYGSMMNPDDLQAIASQFAPVYFDYDSSQVKPEDRPTLERIAQFLRENPTVGLIVDGHTDERGSNEYNLALGERRAQSVRAYLLGLGIGPERIQTRSFGEERPVALGHDESSWRLNRRAEFALY